MFEAGTTTFGLPSLSLGFEIGSTPEPGSVTTVWACASAVSQSHQSSVIPLELVSEPLARFQVIGEPVPVRRHYPEVRPGFPREEGGELTIWVLGHNYQLIGIVQN
jgi:hypothetical protein